MSRSRNDPPLNSAQAAQAVPRLDTARTIARTQARLPCTPLAAPPGLAPYDPHAAAPCHPPAFPCSEQPIPSYRFSTQFPFPFVTVSHSLDSSLAPSEP